MTKCLYLYFEYLLDDNILVLKEMEWNCFSIKNAKELFISRAHNLLSYIIYDATRTKSAKHIYAYTVISKTDRV